MKEEQVLEMEWVPQKWEAGERESLLVSPWNEKLQEEPHEHQCVGKKGMTWIFSYWKNSFLVFVSYWTRKLWVKSDVISSLVQLFTDSCGRGRDMTVQGSFFLTNTLQI